MTFKSCSVYNPTTTGSSREKKKKSKSKENKYRKPWRYWLINAPVNVPGAFCVPVTPVSQLCWL